MFLMRACEEQTASVTRTNYQVNETLNHSNKKPCMHVVIIIFYYFGTCMHLINAIIYNE